MVVFFANLKVAPYLAAVAGEVVVLVLVTAENIGLNTGVNCQAGVAAGARVPGRGALRDTAVSSRKGGSVEAGAAAAASSEKKCWGRYSGLARDSSGLGLGGRVLTVMITCRESVTSGRHVTK